MGFIGRLFRGKDPTAAWIADPALRLVVDLDAASVCGVAIGQAVDGLAVLGPPDNPRPTEHEHYRWTARGLEVDAPGGRVSNFVLLYPRDGDPRFAGLVRARGAPFALSERTRPADVEALLGPPSRAEGDEDQRVLVYARGPLEWSFEFTEDGGLLELMLEVTDPPAR